MTTATDNTTGADDGQCVNVPAVHAFDSRMPVILDDPSAIKPDDWIPDLGTLRQVEYTDTFGVRIGPGTITVIHFKHQEGIENLARGMSGGRSLTVWREPEDA